MKVIDLFCGAGGFSAGLERVGLEVVMGVDNCPHALKTFGSFHKNALPVLADITTFETDLTADILVAGVPCQGFTTLSSRRVDDPRNTLFNHVIRIAQKIKPRFVVIENVKGILSMKNTKGLKVKDDITHALKGLGYFVDVWVLNSANFGVPQGRERVFFIGSPSPLKYPDKFNYTVTVQDALSNIPDVGNKYLKPMNNYQEKLYGDGIIYNHEARSKHSKKVQDRINVVPHGGNWKDIPNNLWGIKSIFSDKYRRLHPRKTSYIITNVRKNYTIHPFFNRILTVREAARLQGFSDNHIFYGSTTAQYQQVANAVPPCLGEIIGGVVIGR